MDGTPLSHMGEIRLSQIGGAPHRWCAPSFSFILSGAARFERLLVNKRVVAFLARAAPAAAGAIIGSSIPLAALSETWQFLVLAAAAVALLVLRRSVMTLLAAGTTGAIAGLLGAPLPH